MLSLFFNIQYLSKLINIDDRVRPYLNKHHQVGMYTVHTDSPVVVPEKLLFTLVLVKIVENGRRDHLTM